MSAKFQSIINSNKPVLVDFYADWCAPCKQVPSILKEVKESLKENVRIIKVDVDKNPVIATKYQIRSLPTVMVFKNGEAKWSGMGIRTADEIKKVVLRQINGD
ncbi:MAG: thioredoxin [Bacteroidetes bacterium]|nr:thioredoxin [Bacteroidota bacterium]